MDIKDLILVAAIMILILIGASAHVEACDRVSKFDRCTQRMDAYVKCRRNMFFESSCSVHKAAAAVACGVQDLVCDVKKLDDGDAPQSKSAICERAPAPRIKNGDF